MFFFNKIPLFRLVLPLTVGIIAGIYSGDWILNSLPLLVVLAVLLLFSFSLLLLNKKSSYKNRWKFGFSLHIFLFTAGIAVSLVKTERFYPNHISGLDEKPHSFVVKATSDAIEKQKSFKVEADVISMYDNQQQKIITGKSILYFEKDTIASKIKYGDVLMINASLQNLREAQNPGQFDYKRFLIFHQITRQAYVASESFVVTGFNHGNATIKWIYKLRDSMLNVLRKHNIEGDEFAVAAALILGYKDELDPATMRAYSGAGAMHVLAVSGLHVGILYSVVAFFLSFLDRNKWTKILKAVLLILFLSLYAMVTGLSPSVMRATVMFVFIIFAIAFNYYTSIYNTLSISAIALLVYDPYLIMQVGFQLSYLAVIGIVAIQPLLVELWKPKPVLVNWFWQIACVSVAAQIATAPLGFLYFHQFPVYFMFSNLIVIPMATGILCVGLAVLATSLFSPLCSLVAHVLKIMVLILNKTVAITEALPFSILGGIDISVIETWMFYSVVLALFVFFKQRNIKALYVSLIALLIISVTQFLETVEQNEQQKFIVYNVAGTSVYDVIQGRQNSFYAPSEFINDKDKMLFNVEHNWWKCGVNYQCFIQTDSLVSESGLLLFNAGNKSVLVINDKFNTEEDYTGKLNVDYLILAENTGVIIEKAFSYFTPKLIIFDSSNSVKMCRKWKRQCEKTGVEFFDVAMQGAFIAEF